MASTVTVEAQPGDTIIVTVNGVPTVVLIPRPTETYTRWDDQESDSVAYKVPRWSGAGIEQVDPGVALWKGGTYLGGASSTSNVKVHEATVEAVAAAVADAR